METPVRSEITLLVIIATLHLFIGGGHQYTHILAGVQNSPLQILFILIVVTIAPWVAIYLVWKRKFKLGAILFSLSMGASLVFGLMLHFLVESPDLYLNVVPKHKASFLYSALGLAFIEFVGFAYGARLALRDRSKSM